MPENSQTTKKSGHTKAYRPEIDGLRAVAVVPVILFHAGFEVFSGGFVGVDIFFVISGYLITSIIITELDQDRFTIANFYARRARRILPALLFVVVASIPPAYFLLVPADFINFGKSIIASVLFGSNVHFYLATGYFAPSAELMPLLHTWSLAVEEQFYILFPLFLMVTWRFGLPTVGIVLTVSFITSLLICQWGANNSPSANFYLLPFRGWELLLGAYAAFHSKVVTKQPIDAISNFLSSLGLILIALSILGFSEKTPFPSLYTILPTLGTLLVILFTKESHYAYRLLSTKLLVATGLISYSLYLWHQPVLAFSRYATYVSLQWHHTLLQLLFIIGASFLTWKFVEQPIRKAKGPLFGANKLTLSVSAVSLIMFSVFGFWIVSNNGYPDRYSKMQQQILAIPGTTKKEIKDQENGCFVLTTQKPVTIPEHCKNIPSILFWGDSHANSLYNGAKKVLDASELTASGCPPLLGLDFKSRPFCRNTNYAVSEIIAQTKPSKIVLLAYWSWETDDDLVKGLSNTLSEITSVSPESEIIILGGLVNWGIRGLPHRLATISAKSQDTELKNNLMLQVDTESVAETDSVMSQVISRGSHKATFLSLIDRLCQHHKCLATVNSDTGPEPIAWDYGHLTLAGSIYVSSLLEDIYSE